jgi:hypothetical protein
VGLTTCFAVDCAGIIHRRLRGDSAGGVLMG